jgi:hypothetical protein
MLATTSLTACDAMALVLLELETDEGFLKDYYAGAFGAIAAGLQLQHADAVRTLLGRDQGAVFAPEGQRAIEPVHLDRLEIIELWGLVRLRRDALRLHRHHDGMLFGRPFLQLPAYREKPYQPSLGHIVTWWTDIHEATARGVKLLDEALCAMVNWRTDDELSIRTLRSQFGYPDPAPVYDKWAALY